MTIGANQPLKLGTTTVVSAGTTSSNTQLVGGGETVLVTNLSSAVAYVGFGADSTAAATTAASMPIVGSGRAMLGIGPGPTWGAVVLSTGTGSVAFTRGDGSTI